MELLAERGNLSKDGPGHIEQRRNAISDSMVNYLILTMLEAVDSNDVKIRIPASLIELIRAQLCGAGQDLQTEAKSRDYRQNVGIVPGQTFPNKGEKISVREFARRLHIPKSTAARWLADNEFLTWVELGRSTAGEKSATVSRAAAQSRSD
jgi:hypothetical protein